MTEQLKAEAYVRSQRPALMKLSFGCEVDHGQGKDTKITFISKAVGVISLMRTNKHGDWQPYSIEQCYQDDLKIIGHPPQLQDWLAVLGDIGARIDYYPTQRSLPTDKDFVTYDLRYTSVSGVIVMFNLTTGQPATEADFKSFNKIVSV